MGVTWLPQASSQKEVLNLRAVELHIVEQPVCVSVSLCVTPPWDRGF